MRFISQTKKENLKGVALLRLDFNTEDEWRMEATIPTVKFLLQRAEKIVVISHRGRPKGFDKKLSLRHDAKNLEKLLKKTVIFVSSLNFIEIQKAVLKAPKGSIVLLENLRFWKGEEKNDVRFAKQLVSLADYYVNDAFAVSHRANASVEAITKFLPSYAGLELEKEITHLSKVTRHPARPLVLILGGGKAHDKLGVLKYFKNKADAILLGGAAANTFLYLSGFDVKRSNKDEEKRDLAMLRKVLHRKNIVLPEDYAVSGEKILDIGPEAVREFAERIRKARTIVWSGPLGLIEKKEFARGTYEVARAVTANRRAFSLTGGGETVMFLKKYKLDKKFGFISTGGTAMLNFLAGEKLPGLVALQRASKLS